MPYRIDLSTASDEVLDRLIELGALDVDNSSEREIAALMPDSVTPGQVARALGSDDFSVSPAIGRDEDSVWILGPRTIRVGRLQIVPAHGNVRASEPGVIHLIDAPAFGTGLHPTTALCLEALDEALTVTVPESVLDVGTGSGVLALGALTMGVPHARGIDIDDDALAVAAENARINGLQERLQLSRGGPDTITGSWPLVFANVLPAALIEMAPVLVRRIGHQGHLVLSGIPSSLEQDVCRAYQHLGMQAAGLKSREGWAAVILRASW